MSDMDSPEALAGLVVVEFAAFAAGPCIGKYLANHGAYVVKVESSARPDGFRAHYPPFKDNVPGLNRSGVFALNNDGVRSAGINLKHLEGLEIARRLAAKADMVIENFTPGAIERLGLGYEDLRAENPGLVMLSTCNMGQTGPRARHPGFGSQLTSLSGFTYLAGEPDRPPVIVYGPYIDYIAVGYGYIAVLAALEDRRRTGAGQYIDLSQLEAGVQFLAPGILETELQGTIPARKGNRHPTAAPHGVYPCAGEDRWCAISVHDDAEWARLKSAMGSPGWADSRLYETKLGRKENESALENKLAEWTRGKQAEDLMKLLQRHGVHAAKVANMEDLLADDQLQFRNYWQSVTQQEIGEHQVMMPAFSLSETPASVHGADPLLAQHTEEVLSKLLAISGKQMGELANCGAVEMAEQSPDGPGGQP